MELFETVPVQEMNERLGEALRLGRHESAKAVARMRAGEYLAGAVAFITIAHKFNQGLPTWLDVVGSPESTGPYATVQEAERLIRQRIFGEILSVWGKTASGHKAFDVFLAEMGSGQLLLGDVRFQDPRRPFRPGERHLKGATHHGFGLFGEFVSRLEKYADERDRFAITLVAAGKSQAEFFARHGFEKFDWKTMPEPSGNGEEEERIIMIRKVPGVIARTRAKLAARDLPRP